MSDRSGLGRAVLALVVAGALASSGWIVSLWAGSKVDGLSGQVGAVVGLLVLAGVFAVLIAGWRRWSGGTGAAIVAALALVLLTLLTTPMAAIPVSEALEPRYCGENSGFCGLGVAFSVMGYGVGAVLVAFGALWLLVGWLRRS